MTSLAWSPALKGALFTTGLATAVAFGSAATSQTALAYMAGVFALVTAALLFTHARNASRLEVVA